MWKQALRRITKKIAIYLLVFFAICVPLLFFIMTWKNITNSSESYYKTYFSHEVTIYPATCLCSDHSFDPQAKFSSCLIDFGIDNTCSNPFILPPMTFKVSKTPNEILHWGNEGGIEKYTDCAIKDYKNWQCKLDEKTAVSFIGGVLSFSLKKDPLHYEDDIESEKIMNACFDHNISKEQWLLLKETMERNNAK